MTHVNLATAVERKYEARFALGEWKDVGGLLGWAAPEIVWEAIR